MQYLPTNAIYNQKQENICVEALIFDYYSSKNVSHEMKIVNTKISS